MKVHHEFYVNECILKTGHLIFSIVKYVNVHSLIFIDTRVGNCIFWKGYNKYWKGRVNEPPRRETHGTIKYDFTEHS